MDSDIYGFVIQSISSTVYWEQKLPIYFLRLKSFQQNTILINLKVSSVIATYFQMSHLVPSTNCNVKYNQFGSQQK